MHLKRGICVLHQTSKPAKMIIHQYHREIDAMHRLNRDPWPQQMRTRKNTFLTPWAQNRVEIRRMCFYCLSQSHQHHTPTLLLRSWGQSSKLPW